MCINIYHKKHIQNFSYTLVHHLNKKKKKKIKKFQIFTVIGTKREGVPYVKRKEYCPIGGEPLVAPPMNKSYTQQRLG